MDVDTNVRWHEQNITFVPQFELIRLARPTGFCMGTQTHTFAFTQARNEWHFHKTEEEQELPAQQTKTSSLKHPVSTQLPVVILTLLGLQSRFGDN